MYKYTCTYTDFNGVEKTEDYFFHLSESELLEAEYSEEGSLSSILMKIVKTKDQGGLIRLFKKLILKSYGEKSEDGKRFIKSDELATEFSQTEAFNMMFMKCATDDVFGNEFLEGIMPKTVSEKAKNDPEVAKKIEEMKKELGLSEGN